MSSQRVYQSKSSSDQAAFDVRVVDESEDEILYNTAICACFCSITFVGDLHKNTVVCGI